MQANVKVPQEERLHHPEMVLSYNDAAFAFAAVASLSERLLNPEQCQDLQKTVVMKLSHYSLEGLKRPEEATNFMKKLPLAQVGNGCRAMNYGQQSSEKKLSWLLTSYNVAICGKEFGKLLSPYIGHILPDNKVEFYLENEPYRISVLSPEKEKKQSNGLMKWFEGPKRKTCPHRAFSETIDIVNYEIKKGLYARAISHHEDRDGLKDFFVEYADFTQKIIRSTDTFWTNKGFVLSERIKQSEPAFV